MRNQCRQTCLRTSHVAPRGVVSQHLTLRCADLASLPRGDDRKAALAAVLRSRTTVSNAWTAQALFMGHPSRVTHCMKMAQNHPLRKKLEASLAK